MVENTSVGIGMLLQCLAGERFFSFITPRPPLGPAQPRIQWIAVPFLPVKKQPGREVDC